MSEFTVHTIDSAPDASKDILRTAEKKYGFVPNLLGELATAPVALKAYVTLNDLVAQTSFSAVEQQLILTTFRAPQTWPAYSARRDRRPGSVARSRLMVVPSGRRQ